MVLCTKNLILFLTVFFIVVFYLIYHFIVDYKYYFKFWLTRIQGRIIIVKTKVIPFESIKSVSEEELDISFIARYLVSTMFFGGVSEMTLNLNDGTKEKVVLPKGRIMKLVSDLQEGGVKKVKA